MKWTGTVSLRPIVLALCLASAPLLAALPTSIKLTATLGTDVSAGRLSYPVWMGEIPGKKGSFLFAERATGKIVMIQPNGAGFSKTTWDTIVGIEAGYEEQGLLSIAFHPKFTENRRYFVFYTTPGKSSKFEVHIDEMQANASLTADAGTPPKSIFVYPETAINHNGGGMAFGPDGFLYFSLGDDRMWVDAPKNTTLVGKMVRIDVDNPENGKPYGIPATNPFAKSTDTTVRREIFALGLRNPWRFSFDTKTGTLWVGDVGETAREEINIVKVGANLGWDAMEGSKCTSMHPDCNPASYTLPIHDYGRDSAQCIIGGYVSRANPNSDFYGQYIFADYSLRHIYLMQLKDSAHVATLRMATAVQGITTMGTDSDGRIYAVTGNGIVFLLDDPGLLPDPTTSIGKGSHKTKPSRQSRWNRPPVLGKKPKL